MPATDAFVQVATDGSGKKVSSREVLVMLADGTIATVELQVIAIADKRGRLVDIDNSGRLEEIADLLTEIRDIMKLREGF